MKEILTMSGEKLLDELPKNIDNKYALALIRNQIMKKIILTGVLANGDEIKIEELITLTRRMIDEDPDLSHQPLRIVQLGNECSAIRAQLLARMDGQ